MKIFATYLHDNNFDPTGNEKLSMFRNSNISSKEVSPTIPLFWFLLELGLNNINVGKGRHSR